MQWTIPPERRKELCTFTIGTPLIPVCMWPQLQTHFRVEEGPWESSSVYGWPLS